jgi:hypothetical protein
MSMSQRVAAHDLPLLTSVIYGGPRSELRTSVLELDSGVPNLSGAYRSDDGDGGLDGGSGMGAALKGGELMCGGMGSCGDEQGS